MKYRRVTYEDRIQMKAYLESGLKQKQIAIKLGCSESTISRELERNSLGRHFYIPRSAQWCAEVRQARYRLRPRKMHRDLVEKINKKLHEKWSPLQISNRLRIESHEYVCSETIYKHIKRDKEQGGTLWHNLCYSRKRRWRRFPGRKRAGPIQRELCIDKRSKKANDRKELGHWERDTMIGHGRKGAVLVLTDRRSRYNLFAKVPNLQSVGMTKATSKLLKSLPCASITNDRGREFADHQRLSKKLKIPVFFCDPYSAYQRGSNENRIGVLRRFFPKKTNLQQLQEAALHKAQWQMNHRPMKCLDWKTPYEVMFNKNCATKW